ncbi:MAG: M28 family peptidase [Chitinophagaceae bacterium]|nr:M28 family peptidase [Chitinophagaceae bacterium]
MKKLLVIILILTSVNSFAQDSLFIRQTVDTLASPYFWGRGYTKNGMEKAADFIAEKYKAFGLLPFGGKDFRMQFSYPVNTFPGKVEVFINGKKLLPGEDFILSPESRGISASGTLVQSDSITFVDVQNKIVVQLKDKLTGDVSQQVADYTAILIDKNRFTEKPESVKVDIENSFIKNFKAANICGMVKGTMHPDSIIFITAHYDHLGGLGADTYFPGANDNASGVATLLALAQYYAAHPQTYSIGFISFAGEEAGLLGSKYFTEHPPINLKKIRFLLNLDIEGTGVDGITVVNATEFPKEFGYMQKINSEKHYLAAVNERGKAPNSDHYFFTEKGVPAFFFYTLGGIKAYHDVYDRPETLPLNESNNLVSFIKDFVTALQ